jgi:hypothetical protein
LANFSGWPSQSTVAAQKQWIFHLRGHDAGRHGFWKVLETVVRDARSRVVNSVPSKRTITMKFENKTFATCSIILGMTLALPSFGAAAMTRGSARSGPIYAQAADTAYPGGVDDATLKRTAAAYVRVREITVKTDEAIDSTDDTARKQQLAAEGNSAKIAAVQKEGMQPKEYNTVIQMVQADSNLQRKFLSYVQELKYSS